MSKTLDATDSKDAKVKTGDLEIFGDPDMWKLICKASSKDEGWMKSTKGLYVIGAGTLIQVTTQQGDNVSEALAFCPNVALVTTGKDDQVTLISSDVCCVDDYPEPFGSIPVPRPAHRGVEPLPDVVQKLFELLIRRTEKEEERSERRRKWRDRDEEREKIREVRRDVWFYKELAELYERRAQLLEMSKKHFEQDPNDICGCAAADSASYLMKAIEEEKRLHSENMRCVDIPEPFSTPHDGEPIG